MSRCWPSPCWVTRPATRWLTFRVSTPPQRAPSGMRVRPGLSRGSDGRHSRRGWPATAGALRGSCWSGHHRSRRGLPPGCARPLRWRPGSPVRGTSSASRSSAEARGDTAALAQAVGEGIVGGGFADTRYKTEVDAGGVPAACDVVWPRGDGGPGAAEAVERGVTIGAATNLARELANQPSNLLRPAAFAERAAGAVEAGRCGHRGPRRAGHPEARDGIAPGCRPGQRRAAPSAGDASRAPGRAGRARAGARGQGGDLRQRGHLHQAGRRNGVDEERHGRRRRRRGRHARHRGR